VTGSTGYFQFLGADVVTGSTGAFKYLGADIVTGSTGAFKYLGVDVVTGSTGYFKYLGADVVTGSTGHFQYLGADVVTGSTGYFQFFGADIITGSTGAFKYLGADVVTGSTGHFQFLDADVLTGSTGYFQFLSADIVTGSTGSFKYLGADVFTGGTGYFGNIVTSKIGVNAGATGQDINAIAIGNSAGQYNQGENSIAIGHLAGPTGMSKNSIVLNASGSCVYGTGPSGGFYVAPIAQMSNATSKRFLLLAYSQDDNQIVQIDSLTIPPPILTQTKSSTSDVEYSITYPKQYLIDTQYYPLITNCTISINSTNFIDNSSDPLYVRTYNLETKLIKGIKIGNTVPSNLKSDPIVINQQGDGQLFIKYSNLYSFSQISVDFSFVDYAPSDISYAIGSQQGNIPSSPLVLNFYSSDEGGKTDIPYTYTIKFVPENDSNISRYNGLNGLSSSITENIDNLSGRQVSYQNFLYPDTVFNITIQAFKKNNLNKFSNIYTATPYTTPYFVPEYFLTDTETISKENKSTTKPVKSVKDNTDANIIFTDGDYVTDIINIPIQNKIENRGTLNTQNNPILVTLKGTINADGGNQQSTPSISFSGFGVIEDKKDVENTDINLKLSATKVDAFTGKTDGTDGYYQYDNTTLSIPLNKLLNNLGGTAPYHLIIEADYPSLNVKNNSAIKVKYNTDIYYDAPYKKPSITSALKADDNISSVTPVPVQLCGIYVFEKIETFKIKSSITVSDIGNYYYNAADNGIIKYSVTSPLDIFEDSKEINIDNVTNESIISNKFNNDVVFKNDNLEFKGKNENFSYFQEISINPTVYNAIGESNDAKDSDVLKLKIICDKNNSIKSPQTLTNGGNFSDGCRINTDDLNVFNDKQSLALVNSNELLYANGMYVTPGLNSPEKYYINYSDYYTGGISNTNPDYTSITTTIRYVTFKWFIISPNCTQINFRFENIIGTFPSNFEFDYKIVDSNYSQQIGLTQIGTDPITGIYKYNAYGGTHWILGSSNIYTSVTPDNYINNSIYSGYLSSNLNLYKVSLPSYNPDFTDNITSDIYLYCRIKILLNPNQGFSFSGVSAQVSA